MVGFGVEDLPVMVLPMRLSDRRDDGRSIRDEGRSCWFRVGESFLDMKLSRLLGLLLLLRVDMRVDGLSSEMSGGASATGGTGMGS